MPAHALHARVNARTNAPIAPPRRLTLLGVVALAVGNMLGTSIWTLPASLAEVAGPLALVAWGVTAAGYWFVARSYARLGARWPVTGGPYVFARAAFGDGAAFVVTWSYWLSATLGNAAIVTGVVGYAAGFDAALAASPLMQYVLAQALLWGLCALNVAGVQHSARLAIVLMFTTVVTLAASSLAALPAVAAHNFVPFAPAGWSALAPACALIVWAYSGVESATVPADEVRGGGDVIARGTMLGFWVATATYLVAAFAVAGTVSSAELATSARPIALVAERSVGAWAGIVVGLAALGSNVATLNGWILMAGRIPVTAATDGLFPAPLARLHARTGTPWIALVVGTCIPASLLGLYFTRSLLGVFRFFVLLAILTTLVPHLATVAAEWRLARRGDARYDARAARRVAWEAPVAMVFVVWTMIGAGAEAALWGSVAIVAGVPMYVVMRAGRRRVRVGS